MKRGILSCTCRKVDENLKRLDWKPANRFEKELVSRLLVELWFIGPGTVNYLGLWPI